MCTSYLWLTIPLLLCGSLASADSTSLSLVESRQKLTGNVSKEWVLERVEKFMGANQQCRQGEAYNFNSNETVDHGRCVNGRWIENTLPWTLRDADDLDRELTIGDTTYVLLFRDVGDEEQMRLRVRAGEKTTPSVDKILRHELD